MAGLILRLLGFVVCIAAWWWLGSLGREKGLPGGLLLVLVAHGVLVVAAIMMAKPLAGFLGHWLSGLFMPGDRFDRPPPMYSIPEGRMAAEDYPGALEAYAKLAAEHPGETIPHLRMMEIWLRVYRDEAAAQTIRGNAMVAIKGKKNRQKFDAAARLLLEQYPRG